MITLSYPVKTKKLGFQKISIQSNPILSDRVSNSTIGYDGEVKGAVVMANSTIGYDGEVKGAVVVANSTIGYDGEVK